MKRIAIDYTAAVRQKAGIGRYTRALVGALAGLDRANAYTLYVPRNGRALGEAEEFPPNFRIVRGPLGERAMVTLWQRAQVPLPLELLTGAVDVVYSPDFVLPPARARRNILTVHDLSFRRVPETAVPNLRWYLEGAVPRAVNRADVILADSHATREDLIELFGADPARVRTLYSGCDARFRRVTAPAELERVMARYDLRKPFVLNVGTVEPRKNLTRLIEAFARLAPARELELVIAGGRGWLYDEILAAPERFGVRERVRFLGFTPDEDLPALYSLAEVFAYPSLYEGFGLPVLEALACGAAVVTADNSSLPEVAGDAALLVNARDVEALSAALVQALDDTRVRAELQARAMKQAGRFSWQASAETLREVLES